MPSILDSWVATDTNEFIFAVRRDIDKPDCRELIFERLRSLHVFVPLQVFLELQSNLTANEMRDSLSALRLTQEFRIDYSAVEPDKINYWMERGARLGDAVIAAHLESARVAYLVSENRHFLLEIPDLPFDVLSAAEALDAISRAS